MIKEHLCSSTRNLRRTANSLCDLAQVLSKKGDYSSPFYERALKYGLKIPMKGKMDDISLILAKVVKEQYISTTSIWFSIVFNIIVFTILSLIKYYQFWEL